MAHGNARTTVRVRYELVDLVERGMPVAAAAAACGMSRATAYKWVRRHRCGESLWDRSSRPKTMPRLIDPQLGKLIVEARQQTGLGPAMLSGHLGIAASTIWKVLKRAGLSRLPRPERGPVMRYERARPGELVHVDIKKLPRIGRVPGHRVTGDRSNQQRIATSGRGYDYLQVVIDDRTRVAHAVRMPSERSDDAIAAFQQSVAWFASNGIRIERVMSDNGASYKKRWREACANMGIQTRFTRPYRPQTNGKAERFIQTMLREWAYGPTYHGNGPRLRALPRWLDQYNTRRYHTSTRSTPWQRAASDLEAVNNVCEHYN
jgi:transposase InsO family protein